MSKVALVLVVAVASCKGKSADKTKNEPVGSSGSAVAIDALPPARFATPEAKLQRYTECWNAFNAGTDDVFKGCFAADAMREQVDNIPELRAQGADQIADMAKQQKAAVSDLKVTPQLVLVSGNDVLAILHVAGTSPRKKLGVFEAQHAVLLDDGMIAQDRLYLDQSTMFHQLGVLPNDTSPKALEPLAATPEMLVSKKDPQEAANKAVIEKYFDAFNKKDVKALEALAADDVKLTYHGDKQKIENKKAYMKWLKHTLASTKDGTVAVKGMWAASDYVIVSDVFSGTPKEAAVGKDADSKKIETKIIDVFEVVDGKIKQHQIFTNRLKTAVQVGRVDPDQLMQALASKAGGK